MNLNPLIYKNELTADIHVDKEIAHMETLPSDI